MQGIGKMVTRGANRVWRRELQLAKLEMGLSLPFPGMKVRFEVAREGVQPERARKTAA